ncbi:MAG TPA: hypothetical protein VGO10_11645 [Baekduia sp.]|nr:hypothetical protein [Baekduia sp.]
MRARCVDQVGDACWIDSGEALDDGKEQVRVGDHFGRVFRKRDGHDA